MVWSTLFKSPKTRTAATAAAPASKKLAPEDAGHAGVKMGSYKQQHTGNDSSTKVTNYSTNGGSKSGTNSNSNHGHTSASDSVGNSRSKESMNSRSDNSSKPITIHSHSQQQQQVNHAVGSKESALSQVSCISLNTSSGGEPQQHRGLQPPFGLALGGQPLGAQGSPSKTKVATSGVSTYEPNMARHQHIIIKIEMQVY